MGILLLQLDDTDCVGDPQVEVGAVGRASSDGRFILVCLYFDNDRGSRGHLFGTRCHNIFRLGAVSFAVFDRLHACDLQSEATLNKLALHIIGVGLFRPELGLEAVDAEPNRNVRIPEQQLR